MNLSYQEQLQRPEWQNKRWEILKRDKNKCTKCGDRNRLHVHHLYYLPNKLAWEYDNKCLVTLCHKCHYEEHAEEIANKIQPPKNKKASSKKQPKLVLTPLASVYQRVSPVAWNYLEEQVSVESFLVINKLALSTIAISNYLPVLETEEALSKLFTKLTHDIEAVKSILHNLVLMRVIGREEVEESEFKCGKGWIFNPYLSFRGNTLGETVLIEFADSKFAELSRKQLIPTPQSEA